ncbi:hydantoinase/oxoprolinase family protein [Paraburkholderia phenazinium]|uniref:N-methylhydantoinase A n=1 Tax=Paraburkholderia phenazinium TaxID=60549 RepID=A0A1N6HZN2_9BURK|nr:hydantoinase/oxoprolinase family protein [Paraburkholderia phenazinium]SIO25105.1 N-methylhydantoinase A [Paraburkholderia phenazinium]
MNIKDGLRIAVDIGGTFTDCVMLSESGSRLTAKSLTTYDDPSRGVIDCLDMAAKRLEITTPELVSRATEFVHGTTVGTNALTERRGARTGMLMTAGHEQTITIGRARQKVIGLSEREKTHVTHLEKATPPIVLPEDIRGVIERVDRDGRVLVELNLDRASRDVDHLVETGIEALAVCLLWSFKNPSHELQLRDLVKKRHPKLFTSISSEVVPRTGEYERSVSTAFNSYIGPVVGEYLVRLERRLKQLGMGCSLLVVQSSGGLCTVDSVLGRPILTVDSGPAGGVLGARFCAGLIGEQSVICADVGGTTFDVGLVFEDKVQMDPAPVIGKYAYLVPKVFVKSVGAGGGSIGWRDDGGSLRVGPRSAGSTPGPAAYGGGGLEPTITDAHVALGYLDPDFLLGGKVRLNKTAAETALGALARSVGLSITDVAAGMIEISNAQMADLVRKVTVERGLDPRNFALFVYGGAGPVFASFLAAQVGVKLAYIPADSGVFSALGMLTTDIALQEEQSVALELPIDANALAGLNESFASLERRVLQRVSEAGLNDQPITLRRAVEMRFGMQVHELEVDIRPDELTASDMEKLKQDFIRTYEMTYGKGSAYVEAGIELATVRLTGTIDIVKPSLEVANGKSAGDSLVGRRSAYFRSSGGFISTAVHSGDRLRPGQHLDGPAIIQRFADTVVLPPNSHAEVDRNGGITLTFGRVAHADV